MTADGMFEQLIKNTSNIGSFSLSYNEHKTCYSNPIDFHNLGKEDIEENKDVDWRKDIFRLVWNDLTPVGEYVFYSNTLNGLFEKVLENLKERRCI